MGLGFGLLSGQRIAGDPRTWEDVYRETLDLSAHLEHVGYDSLWTWDHLYPIVGDPHGPFLEGYMVMAGLTEYPEAFAAGDPFATAGIFASTHVSRMRKALWYPENGDAA